jgi:hypothetical protein
MPSAIAAPPDGGSGIPRPNAWACNAGPAVGAALGTAVLLMLAVNPLPASGQMEVRVVESTIPNGTVSVQRIALLGDRYGPGIIGEVAALTRLDDGRYVVVSHPNDYEMSVFDSLGTFKQKLGRAGDGPGEFRFIRWLQPAGGNLHVIDIRQARRTVYSPDFRVLESQRLPALSNPLMGATMVGDSLLVVNAIVRSPERVGFLLHSVAFGPSEGHIVRSYGEASDGYRWDVPEGRYMRRIGNARSGNVWSAPWTAYAVEEWDPAGHLVRTVMRAAEWFPPHLGEDGPLSPGRPPLPRIMDVKEDDSGRLWVLVRVSSDNWGAGLQAEGAGAHHPELDGRYAVADPELAFDSIIEVIDPGSGHLLASSRFDRPFFQFVGDAYIALSRTDLQKERHVIEVFRVDLQEMNTR